MTLLSVKDLAYSAMVNVAAHGGCWPLTCDHLSLLTKTNVTENMYALESPAAKAT